MSIQFRLRYTVCVLKQARTTAFLDSRFCKVQGCTRRFVTTFAADEARDTVLPRIERERRERLIKKNSGDFPFKRNDGSNLKIKGGRKPVHVDSNNLEDHLTAFSVMKTPPFSLEKLLNFNADDSEETLLRSSLLLHEELPIRLAKCANDLSSLPHDLSHISAIKEVRNWYIHSFMDLLRARAPDSISKERKFTNMVKEIYERHSGVLWNVARGVHQLKTNLRLKNSSRFSISENFPGLQEVLDDFFYSRVAIRILIGQHIALHEHIEGWVGLFCLKTCPYEISQSAARSSSKACLHRYNLTPRINISTSLPKSRCFPYIPAYLHHTLFELLKNSMKATIENVRCSEALDKGTVSTLPSDLILPEININISEDEKTQDIVIQVIDRGGGFESRRDLQESWSYMYTTASEKDCEELFDELHRTRGRDFDVNELGLPIAGLGYGLPISKVFATFLKGNLELVDDGGGVTATLRIKPVQYCI